MTRHSWILVAVAAHWAGSSSPAMARSPQSDSTDVRISSVGTWESSAFVSPVDPDAVLVGANDAEQDMNFWVSADGGRTWQADFVPVPHSTDPVAMISGALPQGRLLATFFYTDSIRIKLRYKDQPTGGSWAEATVVRAVGLDKPHAWVDNSPYSPPDVHRYHAYCAYITDHPELPQSLIRLQRSDNNGLSWTLVGDLDSGSGLQGPNIQTGRTGRVFVVWQRGSALGFRESDEDHPLDFQFKPRRILPVSNPAAWLPSMTVDRSDPARDHLYAVWAAEVTQGSQGSAVRIMKGTAELSTLPMPETVWDTLNIGTVNTSGKAQLPWIAWDECTGMLVVAWLDQRAGKRETYIAMASTRDASGEFLAASDLSWTETKVSDKMWKTAAIESLAYHYIGNATGDGRVFPVWSDDRELESSFRLYTSPVLLWGILLRPGTSRLRFERWVANAGYESMTAAVDTLDAEGPRLVLLAFSVEPDAAGNVELGTLYFTTTGGEATLEDLPISYEDVSPYGNQLASAPVGPAARASTARLTSNEPNPFNPRTTIRYALGVDGEASLAVFDVAGRRIRALVDGWSPSGDHAVVWDGRDDVGREVGAGIYVVRLAAGGRVATRKLMVIR